MTIENIKTIFNLSTPTEIRDGIVWYATAQQQCKDIAIAHDIPLNIAVGVVAALSPNNKWERNVTNADQLIAAFLRGDAVESVKVSTYHTMRNKAWSILEQMPDNDATIKILNGQKIVAFYRCIMGESTCCVDGHARNIFYGERIGLTNDKTNIGVKEYREIAAAYAEAGDALGFKAYELQAITWVTWRRIHNIT